MINSLKKVQHDFNGKKGEELKKNVEQYNTLVEQKRSSRVVGVQHHD